ncbi:peroxidase-like protein [Sinorhizobium meliloti CCNWSX0020]|uniref:Peroxidase-like protein n=1 Tax=Sinorhizobium meliloti CCNWSX0020 TaxID=1107881 RepID=H0FTG1_RHIML|nr:peroxidase-related enzyme [Sinorhizobium meliloti]EHK79499.1 peroxidase-like protein [Sinorhizobium meliloti CCNWSX0020]RVE92249.1 alkylhydroperoxidase [Sinorhizobium meliloti]RVG75754.1 alkylhydroperoxidase [Sinorhizobium meliloti]RVH35019.1 alkylhydroperoxidase [Sinorhizobium meliloti]RVH37193.1 alkylhydroperoxidase [Sinorhizobium meliloti]
MSEAVHEFTLEPLDWQPYVKPVKLDEATPEQLEALTVTPSNTKVSNYVLVLANEAEMLAERTPLFNDIMYSEGGLSRGGREIGALAASFVNRCIYCASVHANRYIQLEKRPEVVDEIYRRGLDADLPDFEQALFNFGVDLTAHPDNVGVYQFYHLREIGLDDLEILDLIHSIAIFGWANRLMHTLGEPHLKE